MRFIWPGALYIYTSINTRNFRVTLLNFCLVGSSGLSCGTWPRPLRLSFIVPGRSPSVRLINSSSIGVRDPEASWYYCIVYSHNLRFIFHKGNISYLPHQCQEPLIQRQNPEQNDGVVSTVNNRRKPLSTLGNHAVTQKIPS